MAEFQIRHPYHSQGLAAGGSALLDAINRGKVHLAKFILDAGEFDVVNTRDFNGKTPLIRACYIKEEKTRDRAVSLLLRRGADVNLRDDLGMTVCSYACQLRCNDVIRILVRNNVNPDIADNCGNTALIWSAFVGNDVAIEILIRSFRRLGLNVNHVNNDGLTALLVAAKNGFVACASLLAIEGRANVYVRDPVTGMTAEQLARDGGCNIADVTTFSATSATDSPAAARRGFWAGRRQLCMSRIGSSSSSGDRRGAEWFDDDDSSADVIGCSDQMTGSEDGSRMKDEEEEGIRQTAIRRQTRLQFHQRSSSAPSMRLFGSVEFSRDMPSSATVNPCSTSLGGASFDAMLRKENRRSNRPEDFSRRQSSRAPPTTTTKTKTQPTVHIHTQTMHRYDAPDEDASKSQETSSATFGSYSLESEKDLIAGRASVGAEIEDDNEDQQLLVTKSIEDSRSEVESSPSAKSAAHKSLQATGVAL